MKKLLLLIALFIAAGTFVQAQEVEDVFNSALLIENQTNVTPEKGRLELLIEHRMGDIKSVKDLFGLYAPSNIRLALNYGVTENIMIGFGTEKNNINQDLYWKYTFLHQKKGGMPLSLSYFGNFVISGISSSGYGQNYKFIDRFSYFNQLIATSKIGERISLLGAVGYLHFNMVDSTNSNNALGYTLGGRVLIWNGVSFITEGGYTFPFELINGVSQPKMGLSFGIEKATYTHSLRFFASTYDDITPQYNFLYNRRTLSDGFIIGFNITVRF